MIEKMPQGASLGRRFVPPILLFVAAFAIDMATRQQYSAVWGSMAIAGSLLWLFASIRAATAALGIYGAIWLVFNLLRAAGDDTGIRLVSSHWLGNAERTLVGGTTPSAQLQDTLGGSGLAPVLDPVLSLVHISFFVSPFVLAAWLWFRQRDHFPHYAAATAITFALGLVGFLLLPTAPPWMNDPTHVTRIVHRVATGQAGGASSYWFEPNSLAAMPSVHVAAIVLVALALSSGNRRWRVTGWLYAAAMSFAVVYLGEHHVLDMLGGWVIALAGWRMAPGLLARLPLPLREPGRG